VNAATRTRPLNIISITASDWPDPTMSRVAIAAHSPAASWANQNAAASPNGMRPHNAAASVIAGLKCAPVPSPPE